MIEFVVVFYTMFLYVDSSNGFNIFAENGIWRETATRKFLLWAFPEESEFFFVFFGEKIFQIQLIALASQLFITISTIYDNRISMF